MNTENIDISKYLHFNPDEKKVKTSKLNLGFIEDLIKKDKTTLSTSSSHSNNLNFLTQSNSNTKAKTPITNNLFNDLFLNVKKEPIKLKPNNYRSDNIFNYVLPKTKANYELSAIHMGSKSIGEAVEIKHNAEYNANIENYNERINSIKRNKLTIESIIKRIELSKLAKTTESIENLKPKSNSEPKPNSEPKLPLENIISSKTKDDDRAVQAEDEKAVQAEDEKAVQAEDKKAVKVEDEKAVQAEDEKELEKDKEDFTKKNNQLLKDIEELELLAIRSGYYEQLIEKLLEHINHISKDDISVIVKNINYIDNLLKNESLTIKELSTLRVTINTLFKSRRHLTKESLDKIKSKYYDFLEKTKIKSTIDKYNEYITNQPPPLLEEQKPKRSYTRKSLSNIF